ncbi:MAG: DinB family protein [Bacteroidetes bacterium]|nr:DinB family protein [Bacteroidota bacterium]MBS1934042.1 DinB family protein [Bacteroidota bacterium]
MLQQTLAELFERDLNKLTKEIESYTNENDLWKTAEGISNSGGNLCLHLIGNLKHFVGKVLGNIPFERNREKEFSDKNVPVADLLKAVAETKSAVAGTIKKLDDATLQKNYPVNVFDKEMSVESFLLHLYGHLNYHLGQINYHRRLLNGIL